MRELKVTASDDTLQSVLRTVDDYLTENRCPESLKSTVMIAAEEIFVNIAHYAYGGDRGEARMELDVRPDPNRVRITFRDGGIPFNPLEKGEPDFDLPPEDMPIGGMGIYMVKEMMDELEYRYEDGKNVLTMIKNLDEEEGEGL